MKKQYMIPEIKVVKIQTVSIIAASDPKYDPTDQYDGSEEVLSRGFLDFEDEED